MSSIRSLGWICLACVTFGCAAGDRPTSPNQLPRVAQLNAANPAVPEGMRVPVTERKIVYTNQIEIIVDDLAAAHQKLTVLINTLGERGGYLTQQDVSRAAQHYQQASWTVRVPLSDLNRFVLDVEKLGELKRNSRNAQNVTEAFADLEARLRNKQSGEERLLKHLEKSAELKDTLELERELNRVRGEIEQLQGQLNLLKNKTELATVTVSLFERDHYVPPVSPSFANQIASTFHVSWGRLVKTGQVMVLIGVAFGPWLLAAAIILSPIWFVRRLLLRS